MAFVAQVGTMAVGCLLATDVLLDSNGADSRRYIPL